MRRSRALIREEYREQPIGVSIPPIYCAVVEVELPDLDHGCSPECACLVKEETDDYNT